MTPPTAPSESFADSHAAFAADREAQFLELAAEIPDEGGEAPAVEAAPVEGAPATPAKDETPAADAKPDAQADGAAAKTEAVVTDEPDPLANAKPFDYTVDGAAKVYDGIKVLADKDGTIQGGIISPEAMKDVQYRFQRGEYLESQNKALYGKAQEFERVTFKDASGTEHKGMAAVQQYAVENAKQHVALKLLAETLENPEKLIALAYAVQNGDTSALQQLTERIALLAENATFKARSQWGDTLRQAAQQDTQAQDATQQAHDAITNSVATWASRYPALTKEDTDAVTRHLTRLGAALVHPATPEQAQQAGVKPGDLVIHHDIVDEYLKDRAGLRAREVDTAKKASTAAAENAQRLAAAARGTKGKKPAAPPTKETTPAPKSKSEEWQDQKLRMMAGQFSETASE